MARKLLLLRHGEVDEKYRGRYVGRTNLPLGERGHRQVGAIKTYLQSRRFDHCLCSPLLRCRQTAGTVLESSDISMEIDDDLREIDFGRWEGMSFDDISKAFPHQVKHWMDFDPDFAFPEGECIGDFMVRMRCVAKRLNEDSADTILMCTHGGVIRSLICHYLGLKPWQYILFKVKPASVTTIELFDGGGILAGLSETGPLHSTEDEQ